MTSGPIGEWIVDELLGDAVLSGTTLELSFSPDGRLAGDTGINRVAAPFTSDGAQLSIGPVVSTRMAGNPAAMAQEVDFVAALESATSWSVADETLTLRGADATVLTAHRAVVPLVIRGHVSYLDRIAFPGNAVVTVEIRQLQPGGPAVAPLASQVIADAAGAPVEFAIPLERALLAPPVQLGITADIRVLDELWWSSDAPQPIADDNQASYDLVVNRVPYVE